jgi:hypothetical protein
LIVNIIGFAADFYFIPYVLLVQLYTCLQCRAVMTRVQTVSAVSCCDDTFTDSKVSGEDLLTGTLHKRRVTVYGWALYAVWTAGTARMLRV